ncbi:MAG: hypothetical protein LBP73_04125 [Clostridiales Family XIII bacterium]|jgi:hypothetical protein|nr:hypothetical protein [Clostridiales Family XIII bacterium]
MGRTMAWRPAEDGGIWGCNGCTAKNCANGRDEDFSRSPHVWESAGKTEWYAHKPTPEDCRAIAGAVNACLEAFLASALDRAHGKDTPGATKPSMLAMPEAGRKKPKQPRKVADLGQKRGDTEL